MAGIYSGTLSLSAHAGQSLPLLPPGILPAAGSMKHPSREQTWAWACKPLMVVSPKTSFSAACGRYMEGVGRLENTLSMHRLWDATHLSMLLPQGPFQIPLISSSGTIPRHCYA